jgi:Cu(I)/Ag(I) efflux system membrane protein CusA/SilA
MERARRQLVYFIPITLAAIFLLLYLNNPSLVRVLMVVLAVPVAVAGAFVALLLMGYNLSVAVWVGILGLAGVDAETGMVTLLYLDAAYDRRKQEGRMTNLVDLEGAVMEATVQRVRPKMMTFWSVLLSLSPIILATGAGADLMKRIAAPMAGGIVFSFLVELLIYPAIYFIWKEWSEVRHFRAATKADSNSVNGQS